MWNHLVFIFIVLNIFITTACTVNHIDTAYSKMDFKRYESSREFNASYSQVWKATVDTIGQSFFVLENIEKDSGILSLSFNTQETDNYVNCGMVHDSGKIRGKDYSASYPGAVPHTRRLWVNGQGIAIEADRTLKLSGKSNVLVRKVTENRTKVTITTRYILDMTYSGNDIVLVGFAVQYPRFSFTKTMSFTANEEGSFDGSGSDNMICKSTMLLENKILNGIQSNL